MAKANCKPDGRNGRVGRAATGFPGAPGRKEMSLNNEQEQHNKSPINSINPEVINK